MAKQNCGVTIPYCYFIGWSHLKVYYYGVKYATGSHPSCFWKKYFTSSSLVKKYREKYGDPDIIQIRKVFDPYACGSVDRAKILAVEYERKVIIRMGMIHRRDFLNCGVPATVRCGEKIVNHKKYRELKFGGNYFSEEGKRRISEHNSEYSKNHNPMHRPEVRKKYLDVMAVRLGYVNYAQYLSYIKRNFERYKTIKETSDKTGHSQKAIRDTLLGNFGREYVEDIRKEGIKLAYKKAQRTRIENIENGITDQRAMNGRNNPNAYVWEAISPDGDVELVFGNRHQFCEQRGIGKSLDPERPDLRNGWEFRRLCKVKNYQK